MTARRAIWWCLVAAVAGAAGSGLACTPRTDAGATRRLRVSYSPHISFGPLMIARAEGYFRDEGLEVEFVSTMQPEEELVALVTGDIDIRPGTLHAGFLSAIAQGARIRIAAGLGTLSPESCTYFGVVLRQGLDTAGTPAVRRLRTSNDGVTRYLVSRMLSARGLTLRQLETVRLPEPAMYSALASGAIDAAAASEPLLLRLREVGKAWLAAEATVPGFQWSVLTFGDRLLTRERDTARRFLRAYQRGLSQYRGGKTDRNVAIIAEGTRETPEVIRAACWLDFSDDSRVDWASIDDFQKWARAEGFMETMVTPAQALDTTLLETSRTRAGDAR